MVAGIYAVYTYIYISSSSGTSVNENIWRIKSLWCCEWHNGKGKDNSDIRHTSTWAFSKTVSCYTNDKVSSYKHNWYGSGREHVGMDCAFLWGMTGGEKKTIVLLRKIFFGCDVNNEKRKKKTQQNKDDKSVITCDVGIKPIQNKAWTDRGDPTMSSC